MSAELVTIREEELVWGGVDRAQRLILSELTSFSHIKRLLIDHAVRFGIPLDGRQKFVPVFTEPRRDEELALIMEASGRGMAPWASGKFRVNGQNRRLLDADIAVPAGCEDDSVTLVNELFRHISPALIVGPHHSIRINGMLQFGFWPRERSLRQYYTVD